MITEAEAAKEGPADGEKLANERAAEQRKQKFGSGDTPVITEADVVKEPKDAVERAANDRAEALRNEKYPDGHDAGIVTEPEVAATVPKTAKEAEKEQREAQPERDTSDSKPRTNRKK